MKKAPFILVLALSLAPIFPVFSQEAKYTESEFYKIVEGYRLNDERSQSFYFESIVFNEFLSHQEKKGFAFENPRIFGRLLENAHKAKDWGTFEAIARSLDFHEPLEDWVGSIANYMVTNGQHMYKKNLIDLGIIDLSKVPVEILEHLAKKVWVEKSKGYKVLFEEFLFNNGYADKYQSSASEGLVQSPEIRTLEASVRGDCPLDKSGNLPEWFATWVSNHLNYLIKTTRKGEKVTNTFSAYGSEGECHLEVSFFKQLDGALVLSSLRGEPRTIKEADVFKIGPRGILSTIIQ